MKTNYRFSIRQVTNDSFEVIVEKQVSKPRELVFEKIASFLAYKTGNSVGLRWESGKLPKETFRNLWRVMKIWLKGRFKENYIWESDIIND